MGYNPAGLLNVAVVVMLAGVSRLATVSLFTKPAYVADKPGTASP